MTCQNQLVLAHKTMPQLSYGMTLPFLLDDTINALSDAI
jgi:hypothetical protein